MMYNIYFDICAFMILLCLLFATCYKKVWRTIPGRAFIALVSICILTCAFDVMSVKLNNPKAAFAVNTFYIFFRGLIIYVYGIYILFLTDRINHVMSNKILFVIVNIPVLFSTILLLVNVSLHNLFNFDNGTYQRSQQFYLLYIPYIIYFISSFVVVIYDRHLLSKQKRTVIYLFYPVTFIVTLIQFFLNKYLIEMFYTSLILFFIFTIVERTEELIDFNTELPNRFSLHKAILKAKFSARKLCIYIIDIYDFYNLYASHSYEQVTDITKQIGKNICKGLGPNNGFRGTCYYAGEGVYVVTDLSGAKSRFADLILQQASLPVMINGDAKNLDIRVIDMRFPEDIDNEKTLDLILENFEKSLDGNRKIYHFNRSNIQKQLKFNSDISSFLDKAIKNKEFIIHYQPIYSTKAKKFVSAEALVRLRHPEHGLIPPGKFIDIAERENKIHKIDMIVLEEVCKFIKSEDFRKLQLSYIEMNLSLIELQNPNLVVDINQIVNKYNVSRSCINFEITESQDVKNDETFEMNIDRLHKLGYSLSLDDYGTGYSNILRLSKIPLKIVKLDKVFATDIIKNEKLQTITKYTIQTLKSLNYEVLIEGVENIEQLKCFTELKCDYIQGYYFKKPCELKEFIEYIDETNNKSEF